MFVCLLIVIVVQVFVDQLPPKIKVKRREDSFARVCVSLAKLAPAVETSMNRTSLSGISTGFGCVTARRFVSPAAIIFRVMYPRRRDLCSSPKIPTGRSCVDVDTRTQIVKSS